MANGTLNKVPNKDSYPLKQINLVKQVISNKHRKIEKVKQSKSPKRFGLNDQPTFQGQGVGFSIQINSKKRIQDLYVKN